MPWPYRHIILVSAAEQVAANAIAALIDPDDGSGTFGVPLSANGQQPASHFGCNTISDDTMAGAMFDVQISLSSVQWWRMNATTGELVDSNTSFGEPGQVWTWNDALAAAGLQIAGGE